MTRKDIIFSVILHVLIVAATVVSSPFGSKHVPFDDVIRVNLTALPASELPPQAMELPPEPVTPKALQEEPEEIPLENPEAQPETDIKPPEEEKPKPEKKEEKTYQPKAETGEKNQAGKAEGEKEVESAAGTPFGGAAVDNASFDYPYWFTQAFYKIQSSWRNPVAADYPLVCTIYFQVIKSGRVIEAKIQESSGVKLFDEACLAAVESASPFPPLPEQFSEEIIGITLPFKYKP
jgi:protein TonB